MSEMIERVAKAIQSKCKERGFNECPAPLVHHVAAAAIEAMRAPTSDMIAAAFPCEKDEEFSHEDKQLGAAACLKLGGWDKIGIMGGEPIKQAAFLARDYRLMIDAALATATTSHKPPQQ